MKVQKSLDNFQIYGIIELSKERKLKNMSKASLESALRVDFLASISEAIESKYQTDVLPVSASELAIPVTDAEGNEKFVLIKVSIPRGSRNGDGGYTEYDGYAAADDYKAELEQKQAKKDASTAKKEAEAKAREAKRAAKQTIKELNKKGLDKMIHEGE